MLLLLLLGCCSRRPPETPERAPAQPPPPALAANPAPPPAHTLRPVPPLFPPPWRWPWRPQQSFKSPEEAYARAHREDRNEARTAETAGQKGGNGRLRVPRAGVVMVAAAGTGKAACRRAGQAAGRVRGRARSPPCRHRPDRRPRCPMKDTSPEGDRAEDLPKEIPSLLG